MVERRPCNSDTLVRFRHLAPFHLPVAQRKAREFPKLEVAGSNPAGKANLVEAQLEERRITNPEVAGSKPADEATSASARARHGLQNRCQQVRLLPLVPASVAKLDKAPVFYTGNMQVRVLPGAPPQRSSMVER